MAGEETPAFAYELMKEVGEPFDSSAITRLHHREVAGRHRRSDVSTQDPSFDDTAGSLDCDKQSNVDAIYDVRDIIAEENGFATRFVCTADSAPTAGKTDVGVMYFYRLGDSKVTGWRLLANTDFDYKARSTE